jgi:hypothetical protein
MAAFMPRTFDFFLLLQHLAHGPITDADQQAAVILCFGAAGVGLLIILTGIFGTKGAWRVLVMLVGWILLIVSLVGIPFFALMGL